MATSWRSVRLLKLFFFFYLLCCALIPILLPIMLLKMCLLFLNYAAINHIYIYGLLYIYGMVWYGMYIYGLL